MNRPLRSLSCLLLVSLLPGCVSYDCATFTVLDQTLGEQCGLPGANGVHFFEEGVAEIHLNPDFEGGFDTEIADFWLDSLPIVYAAFDDDVLDAGGDAALLQAHCARRECPDCLLTYWEPEEMRITFLGPGGAPMTDGRTFEIEWDFTCPTESAMSGYGADEVEFSVQSTGYYEEPPPFYEEL